MGTEAGTVEPAGGAVGAGKRILLLVSASHAAQHMSAAMLPLTYSYVLIAFHISYAELGGAVAATGVVGGLSQISAGYVSRRVSARWVLGGQQLVLGLCSVLGSLSPSYAFFAFAQGLGRVGSSQQHPVGGAVMARTYPDRRGQALSLHTIGGSVGSLVVPLPAVVLLSHFGWRPTLLVLSAPLFLMGAILLLTFPVLPSERNRTRVPLTPRIAWPRLSKDALLDRRVVVLGVAAATIAAGGRGLGTLNAYVPLFLRNGAHIPEVEVGLIFDLMLLGAVVGPLVGGALSDRVGRLPVLWAAYGLGAVFVVALGLSAGMALPVVVVLAFAVGVFAYIENPLLQALVSDGVTASAQASVFGIYFALAYGVGSLWIALLGWVIGAFGFVAAFAIMAGTYVAAGLVLAPLWGRKRPPRTGGAESKGTGLRPPSPPR